VVTVNGATTTLNGNLGAGSLVGSVNYGSTGTQITPLTAQNITDFNRAYTGLTEMTSTSNLTGNALGVVASNLTPGVYQFTTAAALTGDLILEPRD
jgi:hypothetical protein